MDSLNRNEDANKKIYMQLGAVTNMIRVHIPTNQDGKLATDLTDQEKVTLLDKQYKGAQKQIHLWQELANIAKTKKEILEKKSSGGWVGNIQNQNNDDVKAAKH